MKKVERMEKLFDDNKIMYQFGVMLENLDIKYKTRSDWKNSRPLTEVYKRMIIKDSIYELMELLYLNQVGDESIKYNTEKKELTIDRLDLYDIYRTFVDNPKKYGKQTFYDQISERGFKCVNHSNKKSYKLSLKKINETFDLSNEVEDHYEC